MTGWMRLAVNAISGMKMTLTAGCLALTVLSAHAETWRFALIGDVPYTPYERQELPKLLSHIAAQPVDFVAHVGDIKRSNDRCDDALYADRRSLFDASPLPFVLVPGDNEWADCDRLIAGAFNPEERLARLREFFWPDHLSLGQRRLTLERQPGPYPEHTRFRHGPVLFVTLNLPGGNNNFGVNEPGSREYRRRNPHVIGWLRDSFTLARQEKLRGVVLLFQANPGFRHFAQGQGHRGYREFLEALRHEVEQFAGRVVAVHGDTHWSRIDQPLRDRQGKRLSRFTRVETHGYPVMGWTLGIIDPDDPVLFRFEAHTWPEAKATQ